MSENIIGEVLEMNGEPEDGVCLGGGFYPEDAEQIPVNKN